MRFENDQHEERYLNLLVRMKQQDCYHKSAAYLMALANLVPDDVFDFSKDVVKHSGVFKGWQTSSTLKTTRLMFNLWNGWAYEEDYDIDGSYDTLSPHYCVDEIFNNRQYAPYFYEAIRIRYEWD